MGQFLACREYIDVAIPRGGEGLIRRVADEAKMPVIKHFDGNCHVYVDAAADLAMARDDHRQRKCQRMGVCNAAESLLVHADVAARVSAAIGRDLAARGIEIRGDERTCELVPTPRSRRPRTTTRPSILGPIISVRVVGSLDEAIAHINRYGSHHTDAIVTRRPGGRPASSRRASTVRP